MLMLRDAPAIEMPPEFVGQGADPNTLGPGSHPFWHAGFPLKLKNFVTAHPFITTLLLLGASFGTYKLATHKRR